jgi:hypothetical protein
MGATSLGGAVEVEQQLVDLREMLEAHRQALGGLMGVLDQVPAEATGHTDEHELDGELHALVGVAGMRGQEHTGQRHGQSGDQGQPRHHAQASGEPGDGRRHAQGDEERGAGEAGGFHHRHTQRHLEEQGPGGLPREGLASDGPRGSAQGVGHEHAAGHRGAGPEVLDEPEAEREGERHPTQGAEQGTEGGHAFGGGGPQIPPPEPGAPRSRR